MSDPVIGQPIDRLSPRQRNVVEEWLPDLEVVRNHSWALNGTVVLEAVTCDRTVAIKAFDTGHGHFARELRAHREWLGPWTSCSRAPRLLHSDESASVLVTEFLPGSLVQGSGAELAPDTYRQAGMLLAGLHGQLAVTSDDYWAKEQRSTLAWLDKEHRIPPDVEARVRTLVNTWPAPACILVPTHGDWQPRNWIAHNGVVSAIDFGRAALRPAYSDLARLAAQQFMRGAALEEAFIEGYGSDPRDDPGWGRHCLREAIGTAVWAHQVGDLDFEAQGHRMLANALAHSATG